MFKAGVFETVGWYVEQATRDEAPAEQAGPRAVFHVRYPPEKRTIRLEFTRMELAAEIERFRKQGWGVPGELFNALDSLRREGG